MKSAASSSSSGSERANGSAVGYELEDSKSKSNSRMSCASDDSCAINELLEGRMDLTVKLPKNGSPVVINVERRTPMLDLLVNISTQYRFNAANYTINAGNHEFKASTPIGTLDVNQIAIIPKPIKSNSLKSNSPSAVPFQTTFRLQVNLPRNQLMVLRVTPNATIAAIKQIICSEKALDANKYQLVRFAGNSEGPHVLDPNKTLAFYTLNEVTLISSKSLSQIEMQYGATTTQTQVDMSPSPASVSVNKIQMNSMIISQSNPDIRTIDEKSVLNHTTTGKQQKKRQAPPPPKHSSATLPNRTLPTEMNSYKEEKNVTNVQKMETNEKSGDRLTETIIEEKPVLKVPQNSVSHMRQNSGSDSSGYHESVLSSSDSPESTSATTAAKSILNHTTTGKQQKKRQAPPPPKHSSATLPNRTLPTEMNSYKEETNEKSVDRLTETIIEEKPVLKVPQNSVSHMRQNSGSDSSGYHESVLSSSDSPESTSATTAAKSSLMTTEISNVNNTKSGTTKKRRAPPPPPSTLHSQCMSDVSLPLSTSSSSSGTASSINNRSLSPIVITQTNGSSTPLQISLDSRDTSLDSESGLQSLTKSEEHSVECQPNETQNDNSSENRDNKIEIKETTDISCDFKESDHSDNSSLKSLETKGNREEEASSVDPLEVTIISKDTNSECQDISLSLNADQLEPPLTTGTTLEATESQLKVEVNCISSAPNFNDNECEAQVMARDICTENTADNETEAELGEMAMMSMPLPPPSPFQNSNHEENSSLHDSSEGQTIQEISREVSDNFKDEYISSEQSINSYESLQTKDETIVKSIETTATSDGYKQDEREPIVGDDDSLDREIEVTLQSLNDELDRLDSIDHIESQLSADEQSLQAIQVNNSSQSTDSDNTINNNNNVNSVDRQTKDETNNTTNVSVIVKPTNSSTPAMETIRNQFERQSPTPSPTPRVISLDNKSKSVANHKSEAELKVSSNGKTTVIINTSETSTPPPPPLSPISSTSMSPSPTNEDKVSITDEVRQVSRPRVKLTNFSIGSYKKEVDIFEDSPKIWRANAPSTAPALKSGTKSVVTFPSVKKDEKMRPSINQNTSKVNITSTSTTISTTTLPKPSSPVIQTLITSAPKINRIQSWSGHKNVGFDDKKIKESVKTNERYVSQIAINRDTVPTPSSTPSPTPSKESDEGLRSPQLVVQSLIARNEERLNRSPSPKLIPQKVEPIPQKVEPIPQKVEPIPQKVELKPLKVVSIPPKVEPIAHKVDPKPGRVEPMKGHTNTTNTNNTTISIKAGSESVIRFNTKHNLDKINNEINSKQNNSQNNYKPSDFKLKTNQTIQSNKAAKEEPPKMSTTPSSPVPPPVPPPIPPPVPQNIPSFKSNTLPKNPVNTKIFHTKGWSSDKAVRSGEVPKVKHVEPPNNSVNSVDVRDQLLNDIKNFGGKNSLKKVSKNTSWKLEVNAVKT
ncbi:unnamed protein product [Oppiella nova]|uniref:WH2 domain-containing protein n=1 Tax=Oppiella nova TaxID=334625 RepID=A0A7R9LEZ9_9ACAR|nr:unnamed protein product [Oppiella nova]CAG2162197.1 unnamed protein product [Oppiella nova]